MIFINKRGATCAPLILILFGGSFLTRPVVELLPGFAAGVFGRGPEGLAFLTSAMGLGAVLAGIWIAQRGKLTGLVQITCWALLVGAITLIIFANTDKFEIGVICMVFIGIQYSLFATCVQTLIQSVAEEEMRGRVLALYGLIWMGSDHGVCHVMLHYPVLLKMRSVKLKLRRW